MRRRFFKIYLILAPFAPSWGPYGYKGLFIHKLEAASHKDALCQVWLKSIHLFLRRSQKYAKNTIGPFLPHKGPKLGQRNFFHANISSPLLWDALYQIWLKSVKVEFSAIFSASWRGHFWPNVVFVRKLCRPCPRDLIYEIWSLLDKRFMRRRFFKIYLILAPFAPSWGPYGSNGLFIRKLEAASHKDALCQVWLKSIQWFLRRSRKCKKLTTHDARRNMMAIGHHELLNWQSCVSQSMSHDSGYSKWKSR